MGDLISKEVMLRHFSDWQMELSEVGNEREYNLLDMIIRGVESEPTAFDLESAIVEIEKIATDNSCKDCKYRDKCDELQEFYNPSDDVDLCALTTKHLVLEILKSAVNSPNGKIGG